MHRVGVASTVLAFLVIVALVVAVSISVAVIQSGGRTESSSEPQISTSTAFTPSSTTLTASSSTTAQSTSTTAQSTTTAQSATTTESTPAEALGENISAPSQYGLMLLVSTNATDVPLGEGVQVNLSEFNTLPSTNNVSVSNEWPVQVSLGPCENLYDQPFGIAVYTGHIDEQNLSEGQRVATFPVVACPQFIRLITGYEFQPRSDLAVILPSSGEVPSPLVGSVIIRTDYRLPQSQPLPPGTYTIAAADEWGALAFLYFAVQ